MLKTLIAPAVAAFAVLLFVGTVEPVQAGKRGGHSYSARSHSAGAGRSFSARSYRAERHTGANVYRYSGKSHYAHKYAHKHRHYGRGIVVGVPYGVYAYSDSCSWLRHRAAVTGSSYWWSRYQACIDGYYYD